MLGGKLISNFFIVEDSSMDDETAQVFHNAFMTRLVSHCLLVGGSAIGLAMIAFSYYLGVLKRKNLLRLQSRASQDISYVVPAELSPSKTQFDYIDGDDDKL